MFARIVWLTGDDAGRFAPAAEPGEWALPGGFAFAGAPSADEAADPTFTEGWLGLTTFGRAPHVAVAPITEAELAAAVDALTGHFVAAYGAPSAEAARPVAEAEVAAMGTTCRDLEANTLIALSRTRGADGVSERLRITRPRAADVSAFGGL